MCLHLPRRGGEPRCYNHRVLGVMVIELFEYRHPLPPLAVRGPLRNRQNQQQRLDGRECRRVRSCVAPFFSSTQNRLGQQHLLTAYSDDVINSARISTQIEWPSPHQRRQIRCADNAKPYRRACLANEVGCGLFFGVTPCTYIYICHIGCVGSIIQILIGWSKDQPSAVPGARRAPIRRARPLRTSNLDRVRKGLRCCGGGEQQGSYDDSRHHWF